MNEKKKYFVISFSGGKDSTALTLEWLKLHICNHIAYPLDEILYCDTWKEFPSMAKHIDKIEKLVKSAGVKFTRIQSEKSFDYYLLEHRFNTRTKKHLYKDVERVGYGWAGSRSRWCTSKLKQDVINKHFKALESEYDVIHLIGIAADELYRLERKSNQQKDKIYPLVYWNWTEADCLSYCYNLGYDWDGLYNVFNRVSCWCCPLQSLDDLRNLRKYYPDLWEELREMDKKTWRVFKGYSTVEDLEKRFAFEDECIIAGKSIKNKAFYTELRELCPPPVVRKWCNKIIILKRRLKPLNEKDWTGNSRSTHAALGARNYAHNERETNDYYATEPKAAQLLMEVETFSPLIWECACGEGHLAKEFEKAGYTVYASDLINRGYGYQQDFLTTSAPPVTGFDIITNPPYSKAQEFVEHALEISVDGCKVAMFLKIQFLEGKSRRELFKKYPPKRVYVASGRLKCAMNGDFEQYAKSNAVCYAWYVWEKGYTGDTVVKWIN